MKNVLTMAPGAQGPSSSVIHPVGTLSGMSDNTTVASLVEAMNQIAPPGLAESWDNTGLLLGLESDPVSRVLLCIDLVDGVVEEALKREVDAVVAYHPPIFSPLSSLNGQIPKKHHKRLQELVVAASSSRAS